MNYTLSSSSPDEEQPFWIDASGSTDSDGDALTIAVTQLSGPAPSNVPLFENVPTGEGIFAFRAPEVSADSAMEFEISVSDGEDTTTENVTISVRNIVLSPVGGIVSGDLANFGNLQNPVGADFFSQPFGALTSGLIGVADKADDTARLSFRYENDLTTEEFVPVVENDLPDSIAGENTLVSSGFFKSGSQSVLVALEESNRVHLLQAFEQVLTTQKPCAVASLLSPDIPILSDLVVGSRDNGLRLFKFDDVNGMNLEPSTVIEASGEYCHVGGDSNDLVAYDSSTQSLRFWTTQSGAAPLEGASLPIAQPQGLDLVGAAFKLNATGADTFTAAFVFSDGVHDGHHEVHIYSNEQGNPGIVNTKVYSWTKGVPSDIIIEDTNSMDASSQSDVLIALEDIPYLIFIDDEQDVMLGTYSPDYAPLQYLPAPFWTSSVRHSWGLDLASDALVLTQTRTGTVTMVELTP
ncbi:PKD domain-containing protein [Hyphomonas adhaerens MHS-3]|uniref:PKD domain-containing protein n=1 Tax=Hyphomonas adhaerens MHS-3 TaxID=1280949 RepID=A0A069E665_9PROT|nr:PKD domain-containing protein [Hyphomonas adhaerens MHS-3]